MTAAASGSRARLWEAEHPFQGAPGVNDDDERSFGSFAELRAAVEQMPDDGTAVVYNWHWNDQEDEDGNPGELAIFLLDTYESRLFVHYCPVSHDDEPTVAQWLRGPRVLGVLRKWWAPLLDTPTVRADSDTNSDATREES